MEEKRRANETFQAYCHSFVFNCCKLHNLIHPQAVPNPTHHTMCAAWVRRKRLALVPTYFSAQILCAFPSRNITSTTTAKCLHCLHWLQCLQSTTPSTATDMDGTLHTDLWKSETCKSQLFKSKRRGLWLQNWRIYLFTSKSKWAWQA